MPRGCVSDHTPGANKQQTPLRHLWTRRTTTGKQPRANNRGETTAEKTTYTTAVSGSRRFRPILVQYTRPQEGSDKTRQPEETARGNSQRQQPERSRKTGTKQTRFGREGSPNLIAAQVRRSWSSPTLEKRTTVALRQGDGRHESMRTPPRRTIKSESSKRTLGPRQAGTAALLQTPSTHTHIHIYTHVKSTQPAKLDGLRATRITHTHTHTPDSSGTCRV